MDTTGDPRERSTSQHCIAGHLSSLDVIVIKEIFKIWSER